MRTRLFACALAIVMSFAFTPTISVVNATPSKGAHADVKKVTALTTPITGTATNALGQVVNFAGNFAITRFVQQAGQLFAVGTLTGTLTNTVTGAVQNVNQLVQLPLAAAGTCQILHLTLGPLDLNLLGLMVHLDRVVLDITAQAGPGNLLGNLLCAVAHLLDNGGPLAGIVGLLNNILRQLP